jgi:hypothetical protein
MRITEVGNIQKLLRRTGRSPTRLPNRLKVLLDEHLSRTFHPA